jgi:hypothetical protein
MKTYGAMDAQIHVFLTSALASGEGLASRTGRFTPRKRPFALPTGYGSRAGLEDVDKILDPTGTRTLTVR